MLKRTISALITVILLFSALISCADEQSTDGAPESTKLSETTVEIPEEPVLHSFYSGQRLYSYDQSDKFFLIPKKDSEEYEKWERIYIDPDANRDVLYVWESQGG